MQYSPRSDNDLVIKAFGARRRGCSQQLFQQQQRLSLLPVCLDDKTITAADMSLITVEGDGSDKKTTGFMVGQHRYSARRFGQ